MFTLQTQLQPNPAVLVTTLSTQEMVLLNLQTNVYYSLNETGTHIWQSLAQGLQLDEICQQLVASYTITLAEAEAAVFALLSELTAEQLVEPLPVSVSRRTHG